MRRSIVLLLLALTAGAAAAQENPARRWRVIPSVGMIRFDRTTSLSSTESGISKLRPSMSLQAVYELRSSVQVGAYLEASPAHTDPAFFQPAALQFGTSQVIDTVSQSVFVLQYGVSASLDLPVARAIGPFVRAGVGAYSLFPDVQVQSSSRSFAGVAFLVGAGMSRSISRSVGVRLELVDYVWSGFDRADLDPVQTHATGYDGAAFGWETPSTVHNMRLSLGVTFYPGGTGSR